LTPAEQVAIDRAWLLESQDRLAAFRAGQLTAIHGEEALRAIERCPACGAARQNQGKAWGGSPAP